MPVLVLTRVPETGVMARHDYLPRRPLSFSDARCFRAVGVADTVFAAAELANSTLLVPELNKPMFPLPGVQPTDAHLVVAGEPEGRCCRCFVLCRNRCVPAPRPSRAVVSGALALMRRRRRRFRCRLLLPVFPNPDAELMAYAPAVAEVPVADVHCLEVLPPLPSCR